MDAQPDGQQFRATIVEAITQYQQVHANQPELEKFRISVNDDQYEETGTYTESLHHIEKGENNSAESSWRCRKIVERPLILLILVERSYGVMLSSIKDKTPCLSIGFVKPSLFGLSVFII